nr:reverse transcriptase domain-containing protein [Tanacetum cinerariifolium]
MTPKRTLTSSAPAITQAAIWQLVTDSVVVALEAQATNMANINNTNRNPEPRKNPARNSYAKSIGIEQADKIAWTELKKLLTNKYCPRTEVRKM